VHLVAAYSDHLPKRWVGAFIHFRGDDLIGCANGSKGYDANDQPENDASKPDELTAPGPGRAVRGLSDVVGDRKTVFIFSLFLDYL
jgi:hypothetical protein